MAGKFRSIYREKIGLFCFIIESRKYEKRAFQSHIDIYFLFLRLHLVYNRDLARKFLLRLATASVCSPAPVLTHWLARMVKLLLTNLRRQV